jgi:hypothetical protein
VHGTKGKERNTYMVMGGKPEGLTRLTSMYSTTVLKWTLQKMYEQT